MDYDFSRIPEFNDSPESFDITADKISGRIPVTRLEHWRELPELLNSSFFNQDGVEPIFRGHRRFDWALMPTLARAAENEVISEQLANEQLCRFKQAIRGRIKDHSLVEDNSNQENELWAVGQHHGLMTPLLDWTYSPYVALFFAFSKEDVKEEKENEYRSIYILNKSFITDDDLCSEIPVIEPKKDDHGRLVNQAGLFTFSPYGSTIENTLANILGDDAFPDHELQQASESEQAGILAKYICKVYIKNTDRESCVKHLRQMNVHHASLFPDLIGASEFCNVLITEKEKPKPEPIQDVFENFELPAEDFPETDVAMFSETDKFYSTIADTPNEAFVGMLLKLHAGRTLSDDGLCRVARVVSDQLDRHLTVDWDQRDSVKAAARNAIRSILRKYGIPRKNSDSFLKELFPESVVTDKEKG